MTEIAVMQAAIVSGGSSEFDISLTNAFVAQDVQTTQKVGNDITFQSVFLDEDTLPEIEQESISLRETRMLKLANLAWSQLAIDEKQHKLPLFLGLPSQGLNKNALDVQNFLALFYKYQHQYIDLDNSAIFPFGRSAGLIALKEAINSIKQGRFSQVWVGAVDTYNDPKFLAFLLEQGKIATQDIDGLIPSEGAVFLKIGMSEEACLQILAVESTTQTTELNESLENNDVAIGGIMSSFGKWLAKQALSIGAVYPPLTGQQKESFEWGWASYRLYPSLPAKHQMLVPSLLAGDIGAPDGLLKLLMCGENKVELNLIGSHSDGLHRCWAIIKNTMAK